MKEEISDKPTLLGQLVIHKSHQLVSWTDYQVPAGKVFGVAHVILYCDTCDERLLDEPLGKEEE